MAARVTIAAGLKQGESYSLDEELTHIGSGIENHVVLEDETVPEHAISIMHRNGRYAVYCPVADAIQADGNVLPPEQWVWLPATMKLKLSPETTLLFSTETTESAPNSAANTVGAVKESGTAVSNRKATVATSAKPADSSNPPEERSNPTPNNDATKPTSTESAKSKKGASKAKSAGKKESNRKEAKFITDRSGETLVRLGEDGQLPELALTESAIASKKIANRNRKKEGNPLILYLALAGSLLSTAAMLFLEGPASNLSNLSQEQARQTILRDYVGGAGVETKPYEFFLRQAGLAHSRGDFNAERNYYLQVLTLLNSEDKNPFTGLTGNPERDEQLRQMLAKVLAR